MAASTGSMKENKDLACYFITKHSWKGKYKRIFSVGTCGITTYNPSNMEVTNQWPYEEFISIAPNLKEPSKNEFIITMKKGKKTDNMRFSTDHRADLLTEALRFTHKFSESLRREAAVFSCQKSHWSGQKVPVMLRVNRCGLEQVERSSGRTLKCYDYKDIEYIAPVVDVNGGFVVCSGGFGRLHMFVSAARDDVIKSMREHASAYVGTSLPLKTEGVANSYFREKRMGRFSSDECVTSLAEFTVKKTSRRRSGGGGDDDDDGGVSRRTLALSETCVLERDPDTYDLVTLHPLCDVHSLVRHDTDPQRVSLEFISGDHISYLSNNRDALLATLLDGVRASGNRDVHVKMGFMNRGRR